MTDVKHDMSLLYDELRSGAVELKLAAELANVAGKLLKAEQLDLAREVFLKNSQGVHAPALPAHTEVQQQIGVTHEH